MDGPSKVAPEALRAALEQEVQSLFAEVSDAVSVAPDGAWIEGSEERVRDAVAVFRQRLYEKSLQLKTRAAEAAFSP